MKCPKCGKELKYVNVYSMCKQKANLQDGKIVEYGKVECDYDVQKIECPHCYESLLDDVEV